MRLCNNLMILRGRSLVYAWVNKLQAWGTMLNSSLTKIEYTLKNILICKNLCYLPLMVWQILTNGIYRSIEHRATVNSEKERISIATFHKPQMNRVIGPTPSLVTPERPAWFKRISVRDYYKEFFSRQLKGKSLLDDMRIQNEIGINKSA